MPQFEGVGGLADGQRPKRAETNPDASQRRHECDIASHQLLRKSGIVLTHLYVRHAGKSPEGGDRLCRAHGLALCSVRSTLTSNLLVVYVLAGTLLVLTTQLFLLGFHIPSDVTK